MKLNAYGKIIEVVREENAWVIYEMGEGKKFPTHDVVLPAELTEVEIVSYLEDLLHEAATPQRPHILVIN